MKILVVSNMYPSTKDPTYGTFVKSFVDEISKLNADGITDVVAIRGRSNCLITKLIKYVKFYLQSFVKPLFCHYDVVYIHFLTYSPVFINLLSRIKTMSLVINVHGGDVLTRSTLAERLKQFNRSLLNKCDLIVSPSIFFRSVLLKEFPEIDDKKVFISPSGGVNTNLFIPRNRYDKDFIRIGFVSRIDEGKGWRLFVESIILLKEAGYNIKAEMIGAGEQVMELNKMLKVYNIEDTISYLGPVAYNDLPNIYSRFDLFVFPTELFESLGLVAIEAMACGVPVIGSRIGGLQDYIVDGVNGYFAKLSDVRDFFEKMRVYIELSEIDKKNMQNQARLTALKYDTNKISEDLFNQMKNIIV